MRSATSYPPFAVTADLVILTIRDEQLSVLLVQRAGPPYAGHWALPGGFTQVEEDIEDAAYRELAEECGVGPGAVVLEQLRTYGAPRRDPRQRVVTVAWLAMGADLPEPHAGSDAADSRWWPVDEALDVDLAFDHDQILRDGVERARAKLEYTTLATAFCPPVFTLAELRQVYEVVWGQSLDESNFARKVRASAGFVKPTDQRRGGRPGRPARLYRAGGDGAAQLQPAILRR